MADIHEQSPPGIQQKMAYAITLDGGREHGCFDIVPPLSDEHYAALREEPLLTWPKDFYLEREEDKDSYRKGSEYNNASGWGEYYDRAKYFAGVVGMVLRAKGADVSIVPDSRFESRSNARLQDIQAREPLR